MDEGSTTVGIVGTGPAADAVAAGTADIGADPRRIDPSDAPTASLTVVVGAPGDAVFHTVNDSMDDPWVAVELGGIGGVAFPDVTGAVSVLEPDGGCYRCLRLRARATREEPPQADPEVADPDSRFAGAVAAWLVARSIADQDVTGRIIELPYVQRALLPVPGCSCDPGRDHRLGREFEDRPVEAVVADAERAVDDRVGIVRSVGEVHSYPAPYYLAEICDTSGFSDVTASRHAAGVASDWNAAYMKAIGESLERYSAGVYHTADLDVAPASARTDAVPPSEFVLPDGYSDPSPDEPIAWLPGRSLWTDDPVSLPAEFVVFPPPDRRHKPAITTGLGLGSSSVGALLSGLYEVVERDATMLAWYSTFEPFELVIDDPAFGTLARRAGADGLSVTPLLVTQDIDVPVVTVAVHREDEWPRFAVGSGAALDPVTAARSALAEAVQNWMELRDMGPDGADEETTAIGRYASFPPEARSFLEATGQVDASAIGPDDPPSGREELSIVLDRIAEVGLEAYAARLTPRDVASLGFEAVRVLIPQAQPLFTGTRYFGDRAREVPRHLGFRPRLDRPPHPYP